MFEMPVESGRASDDPADRFQVIFNRLNAGALHLVEQLYAPTIRFEDPIHLVEGLPALQAYFARLYDGVESCQFEFHATLRGEPNEAMLTWTMVLRHKTFRPGETVRVAGASWIRHQDGLITFHRDYFDVGALIYERVPVLGSVIRSIKKRL